MVVGILVGITLGVILKRFLTYDPNKLTDVKNGRLVAIKTFTTRGRVIKKGTKGARVIGLMARITHDDKSWADAESVISGNSSISGETYIEGSTLKNWSCHDAEVINCSAESKFECIQGTYVGEYKDHETTDAFFQNGY